MGRRALYSVDSGSGGSGGNEVPAAGQREADHALIEGYLRGNPDSFSTVDGWIRSDLRRTYSSLRHELEDISQMVHAKLVANLRSSRFEGRSSLRGYLGRIVHHTAIDRLRALYRDRALADSVTVGSETPLPNPYRTLEALEEKNELSQVLMTLPKSCRKLWQMVFVEKLPYESIADRLSIPPGTVKSRMWHCRRKAMNALDRFRRLARSGLALGAKRD